MDSIAPILFLKATSLKTIVVPAYVRAGKVVEAHPKQVHYDPDKEVADIVGGKGSHSQKLAHKKLHGSVPGFHELPIDHQFAHILSLGTKIQNQASAAAAVSLWKKNMLAGTKPTAAQNQAFQALMAKSPEKAGPILAEVIAMVGQAGLVKLAGSYGSNIVAASHASVGEPEAPLVEQSAATAGEPSVAWKEAQLAAEKVTQILAGKGGHYPGKAAHKLTGDIKWQTALPTEQLAMIVSLAKDMQAAATHSAALSGYKKAILSGKAPSAAQWNAWAKLPDEKQNAVLQELIAKHPYGASAVVPLHNGGQMAATKAAQPAVPQSLPTPPAAIAQEPLHVFSNGPDGLQAGVYEVSGKFSVTFHDTDAGEQLPTTKVFESESDAVAAATGFVSGHAPEPIKPAAAVKSTVAMHEYHFADAKSDKVWAVGVDGHNLVVKWGKTGAKGQVKVTEYPSEAGAQHAKNKLIASKIAKGYAHSKKSDFEYEPASGAQTTTAASPAGEAQPDGPKDGDTKSAADGGVLVFKDGRWHKELTAQEKLVAALKAVPVPDFSVDPDKLWASKYQKIAEVIFNGLVSGEKLTKWVVTHGNGASYSIVVTGVGNLKKISASQKHIPRRVLMHGYVTALKAVLAEHKGTAAMKGPAATVEVAAQPLPPAAESAQPLPKPKALFPAAPGGVASADGWQQVGPQMGSNPGGVFKDKGGQEWYVKLLETEAHAKNEVLAAKLYKLAGVNVPTLRLVSKDGKVGVASKMVPGVAKIGAKIKEAPGAIEGFGADAWLANHDVVGLAHDNLLQTKEGGAIRIDVGGALLFRAQGGAKGEAFGVDVGEVKSLRDAKVNSKAASVFGGMTRQQMIESVAAVLEVPDDAIVKAVEKFGPGSPEDKKMLADKLIARKQSLAKQFPEADLLANPPKPDPRHLPVDASQLPPIPNFLNWQGQGKGLSSVAAVNEANQKVVQEIVAAALNGDFVAVKALKYHVVDKQSGELKEAGEVWKHPSQHVRDFFSTVVDYLEIIANPAAKKQKKWAVEDYSDIQELSEAFPAHYYGVSVGDVPASERLGFWLSLGQVEAAQAFLPESVQYAGPNEKAAGKASVAKLPDELKSFMKDVKGSGSANQPYRDGKEKDLSGNSCRQVLEQAYAHAVAFPKGTRITKNIDLKAEMMKQMLALPPGHVFQNPGSMCCSIKADWKGFAGNARLKIIYAEGAKGLYNIGVSTSYDSEQEVTTLPGQRFMLLGKDESGHPVEFTLLMLPPDPVYVENIFPSKGVKQ